MALQLVYTSAPKLLDAGRSGFGIVARSKSLPPLAANAIERFSKYANMQGTDRSRVVMAHRKVTIGSNRFHVLSRICDSGSDHTGRTNHIAHHLIFSPLEIRQALAQRLTPADIFAQFAWLNRWEGTPRVYDGSEGVQIEGFLPEYSATNRAAWIGVTGEPIHSRLLAWDKAPRSGALIVPAGIDLLPLLGEALAECQNPWEKTFTTSLEPTDELSELDWVIASPTDGPAISRISSRMVYDVSRPIDLPVPPEAAPPEPDVPATAVPVTQKRQVPPPDLKPHPNQTPTGSARVYPDPPRESREASVTTGGAGNGKLWLIMGGGFAALFLLLGSFFVLVQKSKVKPSDVAETAQTAEEQENETKVLIERLVKEGEPKACAESIAQSFKTKSDHNDLPGHMDKLKRSLETLGVKKTADSDSDSEWQIFIEKTKDIPDWEATQFPKEGLCYLLWESLKLVKELDGKGDSPLTRKPAAELLGALNKSLRAGSKFTDPVWINQETIGRIYEVLWKREYLNLIDEFDSGSQETTAEVLKSFMETRDSDFVPDATVHEIYKTLGEDKLKKYEEKLKDPELLTKLLLPIPVTEGTKRMAETDLGNDNQKAEKKTEKKTPAETLEDEKWCWSNFEESNFEEEGKVFSIILPNSKILKKIAETKDSETAEFSFGDEENIKVTTKYSVAKKMIEFDDTGSTITCTRDSQSVDIPSPLKILYQGSTLVIHLGEWPKEKPEQLSGKLTPDEGAAKDTLVIKGAGIKDMQTLASKTIPGKFGVWWKDKKVSSEGTLEIEFRSGPGNVESPSGTVKAAFKLAIEKTRAKQKELQEERGNKKVGQLSDKEIHEKAWKAGREHLKSVDEAHKWLKKSYGERWLSVTRITGSGKDQNSEKLAEILNDPKGNKVPLKIDTVTLEIKTKTGKNSVFSKDFRVELEK